MIKKVIGLFILASVAVTSFATAPNQYIVHGINQTPDDQLIDFAIIPLKPGQKCADADGYSGIVLMSSDQGKLSLFGNQRTAEVCLGMQQMDSGWFIINQPFYVSHGDGFALKYNNAQGAIYVTHNGFIIGYWGQNHHFQK